MKSHTHIGVELHCGDLGSLDADYYVNYDTETSGYYKGSHTVHSQKLYTTLKCADTNQETKIDLTDLVSDDVLDELFTTYIVEKNR